MKLVCTGVQQSHRDCDLAVLCLGFTKAEGGALNSSGAAGGDPAKVSVNVKVFVKSEQNPGHYHELNLGKLVRAQKLSGSSNACLSVMVRTPACFSCAPHAQHSLE